MKSKEEFDRYYEKELKPIVTVLEGKRLNIAERFSYKKYKRNLKGLAILSVAFGVLVNFEIIPSVMISLIPLSILYAMVAPLYIFFRRNWSFDPINTEYKQTVIPKIISFLDPGLHYNPKEGITLRDFLESDMFDRPSSFRGEDLVEGVIDGVPIKLSDVTASRRESRQNSDTNNVILFSGMYAIAKTSRNLTSRVIVMQTNIITDTISSIARNILGDKLVSSFELKAGRQTIKMQDEEFDKIFSVSCLDEPVARQLLTPMMRKVMLAMLSESKVRLNFSFFDDQVHIGFSGVNLFEGDAHKSFTERDVSRDYFNYINRVVGVAQAVSVE